MMSANREMQSFLNELCPGRNPVSYNLLCQYWHYKKYGADLTHRRDEYGKIHDMMIHLNKELNHSFVSSMFGWFMRFFNINDYAAKEIFLERVQSIYARTATVMARAQVGNMHASSNSKIEHPIELSREEALALATLIGFSGHKALSTMKMSDVVIAVQHNLSIVQRHLLNVPPHTGAAILSEKYLRKIEKAVAILGQKIEDIPQNILPQRFFNVEDAGCYVLYSQMTIEAEKAYQQFQDFSYLKRSEEPHLDLVEEEQKSQESGNERLLRTPSTEEKREIERKEAPSRDSMDSPRATP